jgi:3-deoxy-D-manno-octulosonic-acid transferase
MSVYRSWALLSYLRLSQIMTPMWRWALQKRLQRGKETPLSLAQKWVTAPSPRPPGPLVWGHAVGVGEAMALAGLFAQMGKSWPQAHFLITTTARTSGDALHKTGLPPRCIHQFAPVDTPATAARTGGVV